MLSKVSKKCKLLFRDKPENRLGSLGHRFKQWFDRFIARYMARNPDYSWFNMESFKRNVPKSYKQYKKPSSKFLTEMC
jgi:hypothetical protein